MVLQAYVQYHTNTCLSFTAFCSSFLQRENQSRIVCMSMFLFSYKKMAENINNRQQVKSILSVKWSGNSSVHAIDVSMLDRACVYSLTMLSSFFTIKPTATPLRQLSIIHNTTMVITNVKLPGGKKTCISIAISWNHIQRAHTF